MAMSIIYLHGYRGTDDTAVFLPLSSAALLFTVQYCGPKLFHLKFSREGLNEADCFQISEKNLENIEYDFEIEEEQDCALPVIQQTDDVWIRSGLCGTIRYIVAQAHKAKPKENLEDLLGFRGGSLKACAEVSGWTKLCEVELPDSITQLVQKIKSQPAGTFSLPEDIMKLEWHFLKPPKIHNDDKMKRPFLNNIKKEAENLRSEQDVNEFIYNREIQNPHGVTKFYVNVHAPPKPPKFKPNKPKKTDVNRDNKSKDISKQDINGSGDKEDDIVNNLKNLLKKMTIDGLEFSHLYSEGITITVADIILYAFVYHLLENIDFKIGGLQEHLNQIITWFDHMSSLPRIHQTAMQCGYKLDSLTKNRENKSDVNFTVQEGLLDKINEDEMELSRRCRGKYRPIKPDVWSALDKVVKGDIKIEVGSHPRGDNTAVEWSEVPEGVDPGLELPKDRLQRKCEQLENLVTAVLELAKPGDVIVDFCSGGGHLGIAVAHFLPECTVYLIENKEESLIRAKQRIEKLKMKNVKIYQCNQDYFRGKFDIGMCLHACGVATDMVLKQCLQNNASFVICPCCYGGIQDTHLVTYPTSQYYKDAGIVYKDFLTLGHAADQTEFNLVLEKQGKFCANLVDTDRAALAREQGYRVTLCSLNPLTCTPKNNLLIGVTPKHRCCKQPS